MEYNAFVEHTPESVGTGTKELAWMEELRSGEAGLGVDRIPWLAMVCMGWSWCPPDTLMDIVVDHPYLCLSPELRGLGVGRKHSSTKIISQIIWCPVVCHSLNGYLWKSN